MSLQSVGNSLSLQQIMQLLQQQSLNASDPEAAAAGKAGTPDPAGQNLPSDQPQAEDPAAAGAQVTPAKAPLDPATIKTLLQLQEMQTQASDDVLIFGNGAGAGGFGGDPLLGALGGDGQNAGEDPLAAVIDQLNAPQAQAPAPTPDVSTVDPAELQCILASMTGSAASGDAIASVTQTIMSLLGGETTDAVGDGGPAPVAAAEG